MRETLSYRYHYWAQLKSHSAKDAPRAIRDAIRFAKSRLADQRPLLKDPFAFFSVPWFAERLHCQVVIVVRHPVAFAGSLKRLDWSFDFGDLLSQPLLMDQLPSSLRDEMELMHRQREDVISQASLLWRVIYTMAARYRSAYPQISVVRHEDLSIDPVGGFGQLYAWLGLAFNARAQRAVVRSSAENNPTELASRNPHAVRLNSRANLENWKHRLTREEVDRVLKTTRDIVPLFYTDPGWDNSFAPWGEYSESTGRPA